MTMRTGKPLDILIKFIEGVVLKSILFLTGTRVIICVFQTFLEVFCMYVFNRPGVAGAVL